MDAEGPEPWPVLAAVDWGFVINGRGDGEARGRIGSDHPHAIVDVWKAGR
jgi:hypothetical protein